MLSKRWKSKAAILTILGMLFAITLPVFIHIKALAQAPSTQLTTPQCTDVEIEKHIEQLGNGEPSGFEGLVSCKSKAVPALIKALKNQDEDTRLITISVLGQIGSQAAPAIPSLTELLKDKSREIRVITVQTLGKIGKDAVPALMTALKREDEYDSPVPSDAIDVLWKIGKDAVPALIAALKDEDWGIGDGAVSALGKIGKDAVPALLTALKDENSLTRSRAASALAEIGLEVIPDLIQALQDNDSKVRSGAADALGDIGFEAKSAVPVLMTAFQDTDSEVRSSVAYALVQIGIEPKSAVSVLRTVIQEKDTHKHLNQARRKEVVRSWAILALADIGAEAIPDLIQALNDRDSFADFHSEERALIKIGKDAVPALIAALQSQQRHVRCSAAFALGKIGIKEKIVVSALITALKKKALLSNGIIYRISNAKENTYIDSCIADAFSQIDKDVAQFAVSALITAVQDENSYFRSNAAYALGKIGKDAKSAVPALITALQDQEKNVRFSAAYALGQIGEEAKSAVPALIAALQDEDYADIHDEGAVRHRDDSSIRSKTAQALGQIGQKNPESTVPALITALQDANRFVRSSAAQALGQIGKEAKSAVPALITALQNEQEEVRLSAAQALGQIGREAKSAVPALITALQDEQEDVRVSAAIAIFKISGNLKDVIPVLVAAIKYKNIGGYLCGFDFFSEPAHKALVKISKDAVPVLIAALNDKYVGFKYGAVRTLGEIGVDAKDAVPELTKILLDRNEDIRMRDEAIKALKKIASSEAISVLERYREITDDISHWVAQHPDRYICHGDPPSPVRQATTNYVSTRPPAICRIPAIRAVLRWKCP